MEDTALEDAQPPGGKLETRDGYRRVVFAMPPAQAPALRVR
jgi:hypothetical protein